MGLRLSVGRLLPRRPIRLPAGTNLLAELLYGCLHYGFREFPPCAFAACGRSYPDIHAAGQAGLPQEHGSWILCFVQLFQPV